MSSIKFVFQLVFTLLVAFPLANTQERFYCNVNARPTDCVTLSIPVCGFPTNCKDYSCTRTSINACVACSFPDIISYINGACPIVIPVEEENVVAPPQPTDTEEEETTTPSTNPDGCPTTILIQRFNGRLVAGTFCCGKRKNVCNWNIQPVCATYVACKGNVCRTTYRNPCQACQDTTVDYYFPVICPGESGYFQPVIEESSDSVDTPPEENVQPETGGNIESEGENTQPNGENTEPDGEIIITGQGNEDVGEETIFDEEKDIISVEYEAGLYEEESEFEFSLVEISNEGEPGLNFEIGLDNLHNPLN